LKDKKVVIDWTERFEKIFKQRDYGTLKDKEKNKKNGKL
tara:strand:+ start:195 stop:311 length:117 start_codon:yes stop_codon:yes gene_type:complete